MTIMFAVNSRLKLNVSGKSNLYGPNFYRPKIIYIAFYQRNLWSSKTFGIQCKGLINRLFLRKK